MSLGFTVCVNKKDKMSTSLTGRVLVFRPLGVSVLHKGPICVIYQRYDKSPPSPTT